MARLASEAVLIPDPLASDMGMVADSGNGCRAAEKRAAGSLLANCPIKAEGDIESVTSAREPCGSSPLKPPMSPTKNMPLTVCNSSPALGVTAQVEGRMPPPPCGPQHVTCRP